MFVISYNVCCKFVYLRTLREKYLVLSIETALYVFNNNDNGNNDNDDNNYYNNNDKNTQINIYM